MLCDMCSSLTVKNIFVCTYCVLLFSLHFKVRVCVCLFVCVGTCVGGCTMHRCHVHQQLVLLVCRLAEVDYPCSLRATHSPSKHSLYSRQQSHTLV